MSKWLRRKYTGKFEKKIICFPYAGGSAQIYDKWHDYFAQHAIEVIAVQPPGRMERLIEPCIDNAPEICDVLISELKSLNLLDTPVFVYGHSNGAVNAFEFMRQLEVANDNTIEHLFLAARKVPSLPTNPRSNMSDNELKNELKTLNGTPDDLLNNKEFMDLVLPSFRADFALGENYQMPKESDFEVATTFIYGTQESISSVDTEQWQEYFKHPIGVQTLDAEHFFVNTHRDELFEILSKVLKLRS